MTEEPENLTLTLLREIRTDIKQIKDELKRHGGLMGDLSREMSQVRTDVRHYYADWSGVTDAQSRIEDNIKNLRLRVEELERRTP